MLAGPTLPLGLAYFGPRWPLAPVTAHQVAVPTGERCAVCWLPFLDGEQGLVLPWAGEQAPMAYHRRCFGAHALD